MVNELCSVAKKSVQNMRATRAQQHMKLQPFLTSLIQENVQVTWMGETISNHSANVAEAFTEWDISEEHRVIIIDKRANSFCIAQTEEAVSLILGNISNLGSQKKLACNNKLIT
ncbi:hypothetical protein IWQ60_008629 [Tieghemiomyces parasiticus]|uniref:Uncharacterized protein n=1 Tax=Tieghemiomyces parasiticus TaxID=78921 RepID=A0A9W7ZVS7_9FUNG|nr:hypothetical protein IWQ60_008629 [Tieghemiomyces parasiticus]